MRIPSLLAVCFLTVAAAACASAPRLARMTQDELWQYALAEFEGRNWVRAIAALERLTLVYPNFERSVEVRLRLAQAYFQKKDYLVAASEFQRVTERYPAHELADDAALGVCESYFELSPIPQRDQTYSEKGITACDNVIRSYPGTESVGRATELRESLRTKLAQKDYQNGDFYFHRRLYDSAIIYYEDILERYADTAIAPKALLRLVESYTRIGYTEEAEAARQRLLRDYPNSPEARQLVTNGTRPGSAGLTADGEALRRAKV
ncbi:MAG: outer membrane protein assembly factor BamD [Gemmatimonadetes bacterium]|nr:outer membrane protein assembly factor BamD [Gemmatimonadota bacterium]